MNYIELKKTKTSTGKDEYNWIIDGRRLNFYLNVGEGNMNFLFYASEDFPAIVPVLYNKKQDLSITMIVVDTDATKDLVYWNKLGRVTLNDTELAGEQWKEKIRWMDEVDWSFDRFNYAKVARMCREIQTLEQLCRIEYTKKFDVKYCAEMLAGLTVNGKDVLEEHQQDYGGILLHLLAGDLLTEPLIHQLKQKEPSAVMIELYVKVLETMWESGDEAVVNVVDVTVLERLSDEETVWEKFGTLISAEFKRYINEEVLVHNLMMGGVKRLE